MASSQAAAAVNGAICGTNPQIDLSTSFAAMGRGQRRHGLRPAGCDKAKRVNGAICGIKTNEERCRSSFVLIDKAASS